MINKQEIQKIHHIYKLKEKAKEVSSFAISETEKELKEFEEQQQEKLLENRSRK